MTTTAKVYLNHEAEYEAFAEFCKKMAAITPVVREAHEKQWLAHSSGGEAKAVPETPKPTTEPAQPEVVSPPAKKTRAKKADTTVQADVEDATVVEETKPEPTELTKEQKEAQIEEIKGKLRTLMAKTDENTVWGVLNPLGVKGATHAAGTGKGAELIEALDKKLEEVGA